MVCEVTMELYVKCDNIRVFAMRLYDFIQKYIADNYHVKYEVDGNSIYIGYKTFYIYILNEDDTKIAKLMMDEFEVEVNNVVIINIYNKMYKEAIRDISVIINWLKQATMQDFILLDDQSVEILCRKQSKMFINCDYEDFPFELIS